ncbi:MAG: four-carbon acid sugar kinase family protein [Burkholderiales bacterium]|nr:four-carbon acid sugar kinase family protein [Burkholderiales bacterium]
MARMLIGCIADDLTGATDVAITFRRQGLSVVQMNGVPDRALATPAADVVVIALKSRTVPANEAVAMSLASLAWLRTQGAERIYFKYCSTFDSTPTGNIGPVTEALAEALGAGIVPATPAYPRNARTVYLGHLFVGDLLLSESSMRTHPLTPMTDPSLVRVLTAQCRGRVGLVPFGVVSGGADAIAAALAELRERDYRHAILDAITDADLVAAGKATLDLPLTTGGAGLAMGLAANLAERAVGARAASFPDVSGPAVILAGSCSSATLGQLEHVKGRYPSFRLEPEALLSDPDSTARAIEWARRSLGPTPIVIYASAPPEAVARARETLGRERASAAVEDAFRAVAVALAAAGVRRFVVAGGETSGAVVDALGVRALAIGPEIAPGVPWTSAVGGEPYALALKSGNFGGPDFLVRAFEVQG